MNTIERTNTKERRRWAIAKDLSNQFIQRKDIHARQLDDGRYVCVYQRFTTGLMYLHLAGEITLGTYLLDEKGRVRFTVLDADDDQGMDDLVKIEKFLDALGATSYREGSRRGGHLWMFFKEPIDGKLAKDYGEGLLEYLGLEMEVFPKQSEPPGSLIRVPFGIHRKSGVRYSFIGIGNLYQQVRELSDPKTVPMDIVLDYQKDPGKKYVNSIKTKKERDLVKFVSKFIELKETKGGAVGLCPFHEDDKPSFGVNKEGNYWHCFAGCGSGDAVKFLMRFKGITYRQAQEEVNNG
jgi:hypothetical protein